MLYFKGRKIVNVAKITDTLGALTTNACGRWFSEQFLLELKYIRQAPATIVIHDNRVLSSIAKFEQRVNDSV